MVLVTVSVGVFLAMLCGCWVIWHKSDDRAVLLAWGVATLGAGFVAAGEAIDSLVIMGTGAIGGALAIVLAVAMKWRSRNRPRPRGAAGP
jgi:hypothetical protein